MADESMLNFYKPAWLYESLPCVYIAAGIVTLMALKSVLAMFSSATLILVGVYILMVRYDSRREFNSRVTLKGKARRLNRLS
jgi:hypothetical protein